MTRELAESRYKVDRQQQVIDEQITEIAQLRRDIQDETAACDRATTTLTNISHILNNLNNVRRRRHSVLDFYYDPEGLPIGKWDNFLGLHPLDVKPTLKPTNFDWLGISTYTWLENVSNGQDLAQTMFQPGEYRSSRYDNVVHTTLYPTLAGPGFFCQAYDADPPDPKWHRSGLATVVSSWRTSFLDNTLPAKNTVVYNALRRWWKHIEFVQECIHDLHALSEDT